MSKLAEIEALLFVAGEDGLKVHQLSEILSLPPTGIIQSLEKLAENYQANPDSSLTLLETSKTYKLVTKPEFAEILREYSRAPINQSLSRAALETLSIIAYKQPITRVEIDDIRGVNSSGAISKLLAFEIISWTIWASIIWTSCQLWTKRSSLLKKVSFSESDKFTL